MPLPLLVTFSAGAVGGWRVDAIRPVIGAALEAAPFLQVTESPNEPHSGAIWRLRGTTSNARYTSRLELDALQKKQEPLARPEASCAALIPIKRTAAWWDLAQDERRVIFEERSQHIKIGLDYLPGIARRLHHSRELGEPFDFLTWFEYAPEHSGAFEELVARLRATEEWKYVQREVDIRLVRHSA